ncbi:cell division protein FtsQ/DivIB [Marinobacterium arenosum]|uniref:cell division protein FtsQ/DivIB n=1 Tax=Marinobacterium arenosum TaxID=2862496 RepID=UPI001C97746D|nr:cell division protein FtsQ/DivIB [Marinobacterium arenosum]MBY4676595.1 cell division protein FtsQ/DivIB [Marinobacterium arenosum]
MIRQRWQATVESVAQRVGRSELALSDDQDGWWQPLWTFSALVFFAIVLLSVWRSVWDWLDRPITELQISGEVRHLDRQALGEQLEPVVQSSLLSLDVAALRERVEDEPWVRRAAVRLQWPGTVQLSLEEEVPVARWGNKGLLNHQGDIFWPELKKEYRGLPKLSGPARDTAKVMAEFHDLNQLFRQVGLSITALNLEARGAWTLTLDNGIRVVVGREGINERLSRFLKLYQSRLAERAAEIEQVDIRYTNGVAVAWRPKAEQNSNE